MRGLLIGGAGALYMGWFIYALLSSAGCTGPDCPGVSNLSALGLPVGLILVLVGAFTGGGFLVTPATMLAVGAGALAAGAIHGMPDMPAFPWWFGGMMVAFGLAPFVAALFLRRSLARKQVMAGELMRSGVKGIGTIVAVEDTGVTINDNPRVVIRMRIEPVDGSAGVERSKKVTVSRVGVPRPGERYPAWFDRADPGKWMYGTDVEDHASAEVKALFAMARNGGPARDEAVPEAASAVGELARLSLLWREGALTDAEFAAAKARLLPRIGR